MQSFLVLFFFYWLERGWLLKKPPQKIIDLANATLAQIGADPTVVAAVKEENAKGKTLAAIKTADEKWLATPGIDDTMKQIMDSPCAKRLREIQSGAPYYSEIFVMDNQGGERGHDRQNFRLLAGGRSQIHQILQ